MPHLPDLPPLGGLLAFHHAARTLSFKQTAIALNLTPSAISHRVKSLEQAVGTPLFHRRTRALELTDAGRTYHQSIDRLFSDLATATAKLHTTSRTGTLRLSVLPLFASAVIIPRLPAFRKAYPDIDIVIDTKSTVTDLEANEADIGIRNMIVPPTGPGAVKLLDTRPIVLCAPDLATDIHEIADLAHHTLIHCAPRPNGWRDWLRLQGSPDLQGVDDLWVDTIPAGLEAATLGQGVALTMAPLAQTTLAGAQLVEPFQTDGRGGTSYYLVHRPEDASDYKVRAFKEWLILQMADVKQPHRKMSRRVSGGASLAAR
ncbi:MAG: LysR family transcriptional regulator [Rhodobiaceae bacterium]|nr:LysR family transcriptional regulator [Rhodobiaceae bacterium]